MHAGHEPADPRGAAVYVLAREFAFTRGKVAECTLAGLVGMIDNLAERVDLDEFLQSRAWTAAGGRR